MDISEIDIDNGMERTILGNILINPYILVPLMAFIHTEDFSLREHRTIYESVLSLTRQGQPFDFIMVADELEKHNKLAEVGGAAYIGSLMRQVNPSIGLFPSETLYPSELLYPAASIEDMLKAIERKDVPQVNTTLLYNREELALPETQLKLAYLSPSFHILDKILEEISFLDTLDWRAFEELIADLLEKDGYHVTLGPGTKDGGKDITAVKEYDGHGCFMAVWQAKKLKLGKKVELSVIRELADTRNELKASKGIIVTSTYLTRGALQRVQRDQYILGKIDRNDLLRWIQRIKRKYR
jgi:hypothetical protein